MDSKNKSQKLQDIAQCVAVCTRCPLYRGTTKSVPGEGNPDTKVLFIGEAPGFHEDQQGRPFVGQAGKLLEQLLTTIDLKREDVFIANMIRHRPPDNRDPLPEELVACSSYLDEQIQVIEPKVIVTLGRFSMNKFLPDVRISQIHGQARFVDFAGKRYIVMPMYHPAAALRAGQVMMDLRKDFLKIKDFLIEKISVENPSQERLKKELTQLSLINN